MSGSIVRTLRDWWRLEMGRRRVVAVAFGTVAAALFVTGVALLAGSSRLGEGLIAAAATQAGITFTMTYVAYRIDGRPHPLRTAAALAVWVALVWASLPVVAGVVQPFVPTDARETIAWASFVIAIVATFGATHLWERSPERRQAQRFGFVAIVTVAFAVLTLGFAFSGPTILQFLIVPAVAAILVAVRFAGKALAARERALDAATTSEPVR